jgi:dTDP-4-dehydrorhamnose reductase
MHYNRTKGLVEKGLEMFEFPSLTIVRPSLLLGDRKEKRRSEAILKKLLEGRLQFIPEFWRPIHAETVARALVQSLFDPPEGKRIIYNRKLVRAEAARWASEKTRTSE